MHKPKIAKGLPSPQKVDDKALHQVVQEERAWRDAVDRVTVWVETRGYDDATVHLE